MSDLWRTLAMGPKSSKRGFAEYAYQKADMHSRRSKDAQEQLVRALAVNVNDIKETGKGKGKGKSKSLV